MHSEEIELKFGVVGHIEDLSGMLEDIGEISECKSERLSNTYFDTPDTQLFKMGAGLRLRRSDSYTEQTLKLREENLGGLHRRAEFNLKVDDSLQKPDLTLFDRDIFAPGLDVTGINGRLEKLCCIDFTRTSLILKAYDCTFEVCLDEGTIAAGQDEESCRINELEVELKDTKLDTSRQLFAFLTLLEDMRDAHVPLTLEPFSKMHRATLVLRGQERNLIELPPVAQSDLHRFILTTVKSFETLLGIFLVRKNPALLGYIGYTLKLLRKSLEHLYEVDELDDVINDSGAFKRYQKFVKKTRRSLKGLSSFFTDFGEDVSLAMMFKDKPDLDKAVEEVRRVLMISEAYLLPLRIRVLLNLLDEVVRTNMRT